MMQLKEVMSQEELERWGPVEDVIAALEKEVKPLKVTARNYSEAFELILVLRRNWLPFIRNSRGPFLTKTDEYCYYLTKLEGRQRVLALGITDELFGNRALANRWYRRIAGIVHPDKGANDSSAFHELQKIYKLMIEDGGDE